MPRTGEARIAMDPDGPSTIEITLEAAAWRAHLADPGAVCRRSADAIFKRLPRPPWLGRAEIGILLTDDAAARRLNAAHRGQDRPTNVLSFPTFDRILDAAPGQVPDGPVTLGDVVLALETVRTEAAAARIPLADHVSHLVVHGCLHLLGYDHESDADAARMEELERTILAELGIADPYAGDPAEAIARTGALALEGGQ
jgi:probable rRNA maturation factor